MKISIFPAGSCYTFIDDGENFYVLAGFNKAEAERLSARGGKATCGNAGQIIGTAGSIPVRESTVTTNNSLRRVLICESPIPRRLGFYGTQWRLRERCQRTKRQPITTERNIFLPKKGNACSSYCRINGINCELDLTTIAGTHVRLLLPKVLDKLYGCVSALLT